MPLQPPNAKASAKTARHAAVAAHAFVSCADASRHFACIGALGRRTRCPFPATSAPTAAARPANPMFSSPFRGFSPDPTIEAVYGMIVAQARSPSFYRDYGVPDTVSGRFDMIVLHLVLVLRRLRQAQPQPQANVPALGQQIFDRFCRDMDDNFREMGVGDLAVPKEMRRVAEAFYGRAAVYEAALAADDRAALEAAVARNVFGVEVVPARRAAVSLPICAKRRGGWPRKIRRRATIVFPDPAGVPDNLTSRHHERTRAARCQTRRKKSEQDAARQRRPSGPGAFRCRWPKFRKPGGASNSRPMRPLARRWPRRPASWRCPA